MPELKVECDCGQRYKFDVEPVNGRMPFTVSCPTCGVDGTSKANALLQQSAGVAPAANPIHLIELPPIGAASTAPAPMASPVSAPTPTSPVTPAVSSPTAPPAGPPKLRINIPAHTPAESAPPALSPASKESGGRGCQAWRHFGLECREATWPRSPLPRVALSLPPRAGRASTA